MQGIDLSLADLVGAGQQADVFRIPGTMRVAKIYRDDGSSHVRQWQRFLHEEAAYGRAAAHPSVALRVPRRFPAPEVRRVTDPHGVDATERYILVTCLSLEFVAGPCKKLWELPGAGQDVLRIQVDEFEQIGISAIDSSVFGWESPESARYIDLRVRELWGAEDRPFGHLCAPT